MTSDAPRPAHRRTCSCSGSRLSCLVLAALASLMLSACVYSSKVKRDDFKLPDGFAGGEAKAKRKKPIGRWWKAFANPELERLMRKAFEGNLDLEIARARIAAAQARFGGSAAGWYPSLSVGGPIQRSARVFGPLGTVRQNTVEFSLQASYEIDLWGKVRHARRAAGHQLKASHENLRAAYITIAAQLTDAYYLIVQQRALIALLDKTIKNRESQVELVRRRYQSGVSRADDLYQSLQSLASAKAQRAGAVGALRTGANALAALVGRYPGRVDPGKLDSLPKQVLALGKGVPAQLLLQRPDLRAAFQQLKATDHNVGAAFAAHFPSISIGGTLGRAFEPTAGTIWSIFANLTAPIFQGGAIDARYKESKAQLREAVATFKKALINAVREVEDAVARGEATATRIKHLETRAAAAEGAVRLSTDQYAQGLTIYLTVLTAEQALLGARTELIQARRELISARVSLARALGGSWMDGEIKRQRKREADKQKRPAKRDKADKDAKRAARASGEGRRG
jgi:NodT family efflux transporter outer membrane factor (OMF) lipoprotein